MAYLFAFGFGMACATVALLALFGIAWCVSRIVGRPSEDRP